MSIVSSPLPVPREGLPLALRSLATRSYHYDARAWPIGCVEANDFRESSRDRRPPGARSPRTTLVVVVNLTKIYTRTGDAGTTRLGDLSETSKNDLRLHAYADVDEANAQLGVALAHDLEESVRAVLIHAQNDLFDVGADFCTPVKTDPGSGLRSTIDDGALRITQDYVDRLEGWC